MLRGSDQEDLSLTLGIHLLTFILEIMRTKIFAHAMHLKRHRIMTINEQTAICKMSEFQLWTAFITLITLPFSHESGAYIVYSITYMSCIQWELGKQKSLKGYLTSNMSLIRPPQVSEKSQFFEIDVPNCFTIGVYKVKVIYFTKINKVNFLYIPVFPSGPFRF